MVIGNIDQESECQECGEKNILDSTLKICFDCWCELVVKEEEHEQQRLAAGKEEE